MITQRQRFFGLAAALLLCSCAMAADSAGPDFAQIKADFEVVDNGPVFIVAHRGCWTAAPENSVSAMEACVRLGVRAVEIDVRLTKDRELIVFHDSTLKRMTNGQGYVYESTLAELRELRLMERDGTPSGQFHKRLLTDQPIATLAEVFEAARGRLLINLEIKTDPAFGYRAVLDAATELAVKMGLEDHVFWKIPAAGRSANNDQPADGRYNRSDIQSMPYVFPIIWESRRPFELKLDDFAGAGLMGFELVASNIAYWPLVEGRLPGADRYRYMGIAVLPQWSGGLSDELALQNPEAAWGRLLDMGFDMIMTDRPEQLILFLESRGLR